MPKTLYYSSPKLIQQAFDYSYGHTPLSIRLLGCRKLFRNIYKFLRKSEFWSKDKLEVYQEYQLRRLLHHAFWNVPFYRRVFREWKLKPDDIKTMADFEKIPLLTKTTAQQHIKELVATNFSRKEIMSLTTSGSTGTPMTVYMPKNTGDKEWAYMTNLWERFGYLPRDRTVVFMAEAPTTRTALWQKTRLGQTDFSAYHMTEANLPRYIKEIRRLKPKFIRGFPSVIMVLATFMRENNVNPFPSVKAVFCGSENIYQHQRRFTEETFGCRMASWYGQTEQTVIGAECEVNTSYHLFPQYGITEAVGKDGESVTDEGKTGEIVATGFTNYVMPFIRYRTGDVAAITTEGCECGRNYAMLKDVEGRTHDFVVGQDGRLIPLAGLMAGQHFHVLSKIRDMQLIQRRKGEVMMLMVKGKNYSSRSERKMLERISEITDNQLNVACEYVESIPRTKAGKRLFLIQELKSNE